MTDPCILDIVPIDPVEEFFVYRGGGWIVAVVALLVAAAVVGIVLISRRNKKKAKITGRMRQNETFFTLHALS